MMMIAYKIFLLSDVVVVVGDCIKYILSSEVVAFVGDDDEPSHVRTIIPEHIHYSHQKSYR